MNPLLPALVPLRKQQKKKKEDRWLERFSGAAEVKLGAIGRGAREDGSFCRRKHFYGLRHACVDGWRFQSLLITKSGKKIGLGMSSLGIFRIGWVCPSFGVGCNEGKHGLGKLAICWLFLSEVSGFAVASGRIGRIRSEEFDKDC